MNIIYKLTNKSKNTYPKYYIGCKKDCTITLINGVNTIVNTITNRPYYGSSLNKLFKEDFLNNHIFEAEILEQVSGRDDIMEIEAKWLNSVDALNNEEYYNLSNGFNSLKKSDTVINIYGEVLKDFAQSQSNISKRKTTVKNLGFNSLLEFTLFVKEQRDLGKKWSEISLLINKDRHFVGRFCQKFNLDKIDEQYKNQNEELKEQCLDMYSKGASIYKISEILDIEVPVVDFYLTFLFKLKEEKSVNFLVAKAKGYTKNEFIDILCKDIAKGMSIKDVSNKHGLNIKATYRYLEKMISILYSNETFSISDIK